MMKKLFAGALGLLVCGSMANAALTYNLYKSGTTDTSASLGAGASISLDLVATVSGGTNTVGFFFGSGAVYGAAGNLSGPAVQSPFNASGFNNGTVQDLNSDGFTDVGTQWANAANLSAGWIYARAAAMQVANGASASFKLATLTYTSAAGGAADIKFFPVGTDANTVRTSSAQWQIDGVTKNYALDTAWTSVPFQIVGIPEPASLSLLALGGLSLLARRRA